MASLTWKHCPDHANSHCFIKTGTSEGSSKGKSFILCSVKNCKFKEVLSIPFEMCSEHPDYMIELRQLDESDGKFAYRCKCPRKSTASTWCGYQMLENESKDESAVEEIVEDEEEEEDDKSEAEDEEEVVSVEEELEEEDVENDQSESRHENSAIMAVDSQSPSPIPKSRGFYKTAVLASDSEDEEFAELSQPQPSIRSGRTDETDSRSVIEDSFVQEDQTPERRSTNSASNADRSRSDLVRKSLTRMPPPTTSLPPAVLDFAELAKPWRKSVPTGSLSESFSSPRPQKNRLVVESSDDEDDQNSDVERSFHGAAARHSKSSEIEFSDDEDEKEVVAQNSSKVSVAPKSEPSVIEDSDDEEPKKEDRKSNGSNAAAASHAAELSVIELSDDEEGTMSPPPPIKPPVAHSPKTLAEVLERIAAIRDQLKVTENLRSRFGPEQLPDGGKRLLDTRFRLSQELLGLQEKVRVLSMVPVPKTFQPPPAGPVRITEAERLFGGRMNDARWREARSVTSDAIEKLHQSLQTCPGEERETDDPEGLKILLMPHQRKALTWLIWRESQHPCGGILADEMGLGKTLTMISLVLKQKQQDQKFQFERLARGVIVANTSLIICPASLMGQWENEVKNRLESGRLKVLLFHGPKRETDPRRMARYDVVITTYKTVASELGAEITTVGSDEDEKPGCQSVLLKLAFMRVILDEGHNIKNHTALQSQACCKVIAGARWVVTGTPIHNKLMEFFSLLKFLRCSPFDELPVWKNWIEPAGKSDRADKRLKTLVDCILIRRTKAQIDPSTGKAIVDLPTKTSEVVYLTLSPAEKRIYDRMFQHSKKVVANFIKSQEEKDSELVRWSKGEVTREQLGYRTGPNPFRKTDANAGGEPTGRTNQVDILVMLLRLRQACAHLHLMEAAVNMEQLKNDGEVEMDLENQFRDLNLEEMTEEQRKNPDIEGLFKLNYKSTKVEAVLNRLAEIQRLSQGRATEKCIIVSQWVGFLDIVESHLRRLNVKFTSITGSVPICDRTQRMEDFNKSGGPTVMLLSLTAGGVGLNLIGANHLILVDLHWNPALELQASDRIHRMGQKKDVIIHKFVCRDTIEERILELQTNKLKLADSLLTGAGAKGVNKLSLSDLKLMFGIGAEASPQKRRGFAPVASKK